MSDKIEKPVLKVVEGKPSSGITVNYINRRVLKNGDGVDATMNEIAAFIEAGGITNCCVVLLTDKDEVIDTWANGELPYKMVGCLESIKQDFIDICIDRRKDLFLD